jgi:excisionase family DNA binding protein
MSDPRRRDDDDLLPIPEVARILGVHQRTVWSLLNNDDDPIATYQIGRRRLVNRSELRAWIARRRRDTTPTQVSRIVESVMKDLGR